MIKTILIKLVQAILGAAMLAGLLAAMLEYFDVLTP